MKSTSLDISLKFGDQTQDPILIETNLDIKIGNQASENMRKKLGYILEKKGDIHFFIKFYVPQGRQKQAVQYLQRSMDQPDEEERNNLNPLQNFLKRPKSSGKVIFEEKPGVIKVHYSFYEQYTFDKLPQLITKILTKANQGSFEPNIKLKGLIRGEQSQLIKDKTQVRGNYGQLKMHLQNLHAKLLGQFIFLFLQESKGQSVGNFQNLQRDPLYNMLMLGCRKIKLDYDFICFRRIANLYNRAADVERSNRPDPYPNKDLIKQKIEIEVAIPNVGTIQGSLKFSNEGVLQRFLKTIRSSIRKIQNGGIKQR